MPLSGRFHGSLRSLSGRADLSTSSWFAASVPFQAPRLSQFQRRGIELFRSDRKMCHRSISLPLSMRRRLPSTQQGLPHVHVRLFAVFAARVGTRQQVQVPFAKPISEVLMSLQPFIGATNLHTHTCRGRGFFSDCVFLHCAKKYDTRHKTSDSQLLSPDRGGKTRPQGSMKYGAEIQSDLKRLMPVQWCSGMLSCGSPGHSKHIVPLPFNLMRGICHRPSATWPSPGESRCLLHGQDVSARRRVPKPSLQAAGSHDSWQTMSPSCKATISG
ncbi:unnamed protein product [Polarella glacialis]|uniref:Uncharacterized protein n=1 Tax=Polarella glacialis TaxID=89957 RepID=A0A813KPD4_POLGL|nr:unnamed protein product [Polarella glacialis]